MELFSKRNKRGSLRSYQYRHRLLPSGREDENDASLIKKSTRKRIHELLKYFTSTDKFIERYFLVHDQNIDSFFLFRKMLTDFSSRELGYDMAEYIKCETFEFVNEKADDFKFFDLIETLLIFAQKDQRDSMAKRINKVLKEEGEPFMIHGFMIVDGEQSGLRSIITLIKDATLKKGLEDYYRNANTDTGYEMLARISASLLQRIFSSPVSKEKTKDYSEELCKAVAEKWTDKTNEDDLKKLLNDTIKNAKELSNQVTNIRHTDQSTIPVDSPKIHKMIAGKNMNIVELIILTLPERFILEQDPEEMKQSYIDDYQIKATLKPYIPKKNVKEVDDIDPEDIPF